MREESVDMLVVGAGGAGLRAAIAARESAPGLRVVIAVKGKLGRAGVTATACSDRMAFHATLPYTEPGGPDNWKHHAEDVYRIGGRVSDGRLAEVLARGSGAAFEYLEKLGVPWAKTPEGRADQFVTDGSKYARACYVGPTTAIEIEKALVARARELDLEVWEDATLVRVLGRGTSCAGALLVTNKHDGPVLVASHAVVLATGGPGRTFGTNVYPEGMTAEAAAAALDAGAELVNLEFIQIGLCSVKTKLACSGTLMRALPRFVDANGDEFLPGTLPHLPASERQTLVLRKGASWPVSLEEPSHAIDIACARARTSGPIHLDFSRDPEGFDGGRFSKEIVGWPLEAGALEAAGEGAKRSPFGRLRAMNPKVVAWFKARGIDIERGDTIEIAPSVQHFQGGIRIGPDAGTRVRGLFACGEAAGGQHGANRPGGHALLDSQVFGRIAGESAARCRASDGEPAGLDDALRCQAREWIERARSIPHDQCERVKAQVAELLDRACLVVRTAKCLDEAREAIKKLSADMSDAGGGSLEEGSEALGALSFGEALVQAVSRRTESRGPHLRFESEDSAEPVPRDDSGGPFWTLVRKEGGELVLERGTPPGLGFE